MENKDLIKKLEEISGDMDNFLHDSALLTVVKDFKGIKEKMDSLIGDLEDETEGD